jgi:hypothetical protein
MMRRRRVSRISPLLPSPSAALRFGLFSQALFILPGVLILRALCASSRLAGGSRRLGRSSARRSAASC